MTTTDPPQCEIMGATHVVRNRVKFGKGPITENPFPYQLMHCTKDIDRVSCDWHTHKCKIYWDIVFATAPTVSAVAKDPHFFFFFFVGPLSDWSGQTLLFSYWSTQTECSTHACSSQQSCVAHCTLVFPPIPQFTNHSVLLTSFGIVADIFGWLRRFRGPLGVIFCIVGLDSENIKAFSLLSLL